MKKVQLLTEAQARTRWRAGGGVIRGVPHSTNQTARATCTERGRKWTHAGNSIPRGRKRRSRRNTGQFWPHMGTGIMWLHGDKDVVDWREVVHKTATSDVTASHRDSENYKWFGSQAGSWHNCRNPENKNGQSRRWFRNSDTRTLI